MSMTRRRRLQSSCLALALVLVGAQCEDEKPPAPSPADKAGEEPSESPATARLDPKTDAFVVTYAGDRGKFADTSKLEAVPEAARGMVRVKLLSGPEAPPGMVWVANLQTPEPDGSYVLTTFARDGFEDHALGLGLSSKFEIPEGIEPPEQVAAPTGEVVVYKTSWCGVCKSLEKFLKKEGVQYVAKDIEKDAAAAAELKAKAAAQGVPTGSVPITDVRGKLVVGFDRKRFQQMLAP